MRIKGIVSDLEKKEKKIIPLVVSIVAIAVVAGIIYYYNIQASPQEDLKSQWISSGPFAIDKPRYKLGENIFLYVSGLKPNEAGVISFLRPNGDQYTEVIFNATLKDHFTYYFTPTTGVRKQIYKPEQLVGTWTVIFQGVEYESLKFKIVNEYIRGGEANVPNIEYLNKSSG